MQLKLDVPITLAVGLVVTGLVLVLSTFGRDTGPQDSANRAPAVSVLSAAAELPAEEILEGSFKGEVKLNWGLTGVLSDTLSTPTPTPPAVGNTYLYTDSMEADLGAMELGLLIQQSGANITAYVDLDSTLVFSMEHTIQATPVGPTPFPGTPAPGATPLAVGPELTGTFDGTNLDLRSDLLSLDIAGKTGVKQQFQLTGTVDRQPNLITITGEYRETIWNYMPQPVTVVGSFTLHQAVFLENPDNTPTPRPTSTPVTPGAPTHTPTPTSTATPQPGGNGATVTGLVYNDQNKNGSQDGNEPGIAGAEVTLTDGTRSGALTRTATTNASGIYTLANIPVGQYSLQVKVPAGQIGPDPAPVTVTVTGKETVNVPSVPVQTENVIYLPSVSR